MESDDRITPEDIRTIRLCATEFQRLNEKHNGGPPGNGNIRRLSENTVAVAEKLERRLAVV